MKKLSGCFIYTLAFIIGSIGITMAIALFVAKEENSTIAGFIVFLLTCLILYFLLYTHKRSKTIKGAWTMPVSSLHNIKEDISVNIIESYKKNQDCISVKHSLELYKPSQQEATLIYAFKQLVKELLENGYASEEDGGRLVTFFKNIGLPVNTMQRLDEYMQLSKLILINCVLSGKIPTGIKPPMKRFLHFEEHEQIVLTLENTTYNELVEIKTRVGLSSGSSLRVSKGFYVRSGSFFSTPITSQQLQKKGEGSFCITNKNIYFISDTKSVKIPYNKILSYSSYSDGIGIHLTDSRRRPIIIGKIDGWFVYNIVTNIEHIS